MSDQSNVDSQSVVELSKGRLLSFVGNCYRSALQKLNDAYRAKRPAAILVSKGRWGPSHVIDSFQNGIDDDALVARIERSCADATSFMQEVIASIGFDPTGMGLADLEKVLELFLQHQRKNRRRTIIAIQYSDIHGWWVLDTARRLIEREAAEKFGLMIILSGPPDVITALNDPILDVINTQAGERIVLTPFSLIETRDFVRQRVAATSASNGTSGDVGRVFSFDSVSMIHEIAGGIPDDVEELCRKSLELISGTGEKRVSIDVVKNAASLAKLSAELPETVADLPILDPDPDELNPPKLLVESPGEDSSEIVLKEGSLLVGRDQLCKVCVAAIGISRFHGMILKAGRKVHYVDLNSTNGSRINGDKVERHSLQDNDVIKVGTTRITFVAGEEKPRSAVSKVQKIEEFSELDNSMNAPITRLSPELQAFRSS